MAINTSWGLASVEHCSTHPAPADAVTVRDLLIEPASSGVDVVRGGTVSYIPRTRGRR